MILHLLLGFFIPWMICIMHLYKKDKMLFFLFAPFFSVVASLINKLGFYFDFWEVLPFPTQRSFASIPFDVGIYPVLACYCVFFIKKTNKPYFVLVLTTLLTTFLELVFVFFERVTYRNGWNIYLTFFSYLLPYSFLYWYYRFLLKISILK